MKGTLNPLYSVPTSILIGSLLISLAVLLHGGIIKVGQPVSGTATAPVAQPQQGERVAKTEADIVKSLKDQAKALGLDQGKFDSCLDSGEKAQLVKDDLSEGSQAGVTGTPGFFVNGRLISGAQPFEEFRKIIEEELNGTAPANTQRVEVGVGNLPVMGSTNAPVTLIEFSDYECPFCARFYTQTEGQIKSEYIDTGKVKFYYRDFPLPQIHPGAQKAAEAARCAGDQGKYWEYHNLVFENQQNIF